MKPKLYTMICIGQTILTMSRSENFSLSIAEIHLRNCFTSGATLEEAMDMASDVLRMTLYDLEQEGVAIPTASAVSAVPYGEKEFVSLVGCDTACSTT